MLHLIALSVANLATGMMWSILPGKLLAGGIFAGFTISVASTSHRIPLQGGGS